MERHAFICTRSNNLTKTSKNLQSSLEFIGFQVNWLVNKPNIFDAYREGYESSDKDNKSQYIFCHDDIEILTTPSIVRDVLNSYLFRHTTGFIGVAGTTYLDVDAVWWNHEHWKSGHHSGLIYHGNDILSSNLDYYGPHKRVVALDGVFLATNGLVLRNLDLKKPSYFEGDWDFYDINMTVSAHKNGFQNYTVPIQIRHESIGQLAGRDSWMKNRAAFIYNNRLPIRI